MKVLKSLKKERNRILSLLLVFVMTAGIVIPMLGMTMTVQADDGDGNVTITVVNGSATYSYEDESVDGGVVEEVVTGTSEGTTKSIETDKTVLISNLAAQDENYVLKSVEGAETSDEGSTYTVTDSSVVITYVPKYIEITDLKAEVSKDAEENTGDDVILTWNAQTDSSIDANIADYNLYIYQNDTLIKSSEDDNKTAAYSTENTYTVVGGRTLSATYKVIAAYKTVAETDFQSRDNWASADWKAIYKVTFGDVKNIISSGSNGTVSASANGLEQPITCVSGTQFEVKAGNNAEDVNLVLGLAPNTHYGIWSLKVNDTESKGDVENNQLCLTVTQDTSINVYWGFMTFQPTPQNNEYEAVGAEEDATITLGNGEAGATTYYNSASGNTANTLNVANPTTVSSSFTDASYEINAEDLFGNNNYAVVKAYSTKEDQMDSDISTSYYYHVPESADASNATVTCVDEEGNAQPYDGSWSGKDVTVSYVYDSTDKRVYDGMQVGFADSVDGTPDTWTNMNATQDGNIYTYSYTVSSMNGQYPVFRWFITNPTNNTQVVGEKSALNQKIQVDETMPVIALTGYPTETWIGTDANIIVSNTNPCQYSGTSYQYVVSDTAIEDVANTEVTWNDVNAANHIFTVAGQEDAVTEQYVYVRAKSGAVNAEYAYYTNEMIVKIDKKAPETAVLTMNPETPTGTNGWYNDVVPSAVLAPTPQEDGEEAGSGITTFYRVYADNTVKGSWLTVSDEMNVLNSITEQGQYTIEYYSKDAVGNCDKPESAPNTKRVLVDNETPETPQIEFTTQNTSLLAHIVNFLSFKYFCKEQINVTLTSSDTLSGVGSLTYWTIQNGEKSEKVSVSGDTATFALPAGFKGTVSAYATDVAGNQSQTAVSDGAIYENISSVITIKSDVDSDKWQNKDFSFHVITQDTESGLRNVEYKLNGKVVYTKDFTDLSDVTYMDQNDVKVTDEAETSTGYKLEVTVTDNAGNVTTDSKDAFLDKTAPEITLSGIKEDSFSNTTQSLQVTVKEQIYDKNDVTIKASRVLDGTTYEVNTQLFKGNVIETTQTFDFTEDGEYEVVVDAKDAAGNEAETKKINFTVDATAPEIEITGPEEDSYSSSDANVDVKVTDSFFKDDDVEITVTKTLDGATENYNFGTWTNQAKDTTLSHVFSDDGTYDIKVTAKDKAGNEAKPQELSFTVDETAPEVAIGGADDYFITSNAVTLDYNVTESYFDTDTVSITMEKTDASGAVTSTELGNWANTGKESALSYTIANDGESDGIYTTTITATDKAGNESTVSKTVTVDTSDPIIKYVDNMNGQYYQSFQLSQDADDMIEDLTVPEYTMYLNSEEYDGYTEITDEGKYVFKMDVTDEVGHEAVAKAEFIVDHTAPDVLFTGAEDGMVSYESVKMGISLADADDSITAVNVDGNAQDFNTDNMTYSTTISSKGEHQVMVEAVDYAGNKTTVPVSITIKNKSVFQKWVENKPLFVGTIVVVAAAAGGLGVAGATGVIGKKGVEVAAKKSLHGLKGKITPKK